MDSRLRRRYAGEDRKAEIRKLSQRQVRTYVSLPDGLRDVWLDSGGDDDLFCEIPGSDLERIVYTIRSVGLCDVFKPDYRFRETLRLVLEVGQWFEEHFKLENVKDYIRPVAELGLPAEVPESLPCANGDDGVRALLEVETWRAILANAANSDTKGTHAVTLVAAGVRTALRNAGHDLGAVLGPEVAELTQIVQEAPPFIREAEFLGLAEQAELAAIGTQGGAELVRRAKEATCNFFRLKRTNDVRENSDTLRLPEPLGTSVLAVFEACLDYLRDEQQAIEEEELFGNPEQLFKTVLKSLSQTDAIRDGQVDGRPATEVLAERLDALEWPEFFLLASHVLGGSAGEDAARRWLEALGGGPISEEED